MFPDNNYIPAVITLAPGHRRGRQEHRLHPRAQPASTPTPPTAAQPLDRDHHAAARTSAARCAGSPPPSASSARATAASTTSQGVRVGGPPPRPLDRFFTRAARTATSQVGPALQRQQRAAALLAARPGRAARRHRPVPLPVAPERRASDDAEAAQAAAAPAAFRCRSRRRPGTQRGPAAARRSRRPPEAGNHRRRLGRRAHLAVGRRALADVPQGAEGHQLVLHARLGDDVRLPLPGRHRRVPGDVLPPRRRRAAPTSRSATSPTTSSSASSCAACTSGARR